MDVTALKTGGIIKQRQKDLFTVRLKCPGGRLPLDRLERILAVARRHGRDYVHLSVRQSIEIPYVNAADLPAVRAELGEAGQGIASCGPRVRVPTACAGCEYNPNGLGDTQKLAALVAERYFGTGRFPHKFKITFGGCPTDCPHSAQADLGFLAAVEPRWDEKACTGCGVCAVACGEGAIEDRDGFPHFIPDRCLYCGDCIRACPASAWSAGRTGWIARVGGKHGRHPIMAANVATFLWDDEVPEFIGAVTGWYERQGARYRRTRIGTILQDDAMWTDFLAALRARFPERVLPGNLPKPQPLSVHKPYQKEYVDEYASGGGI
ncbi:MAG: 4Fe-4S binding protein [Deltaproteobacteria bacterium]|nr:4Fe-4S binding protein [Deltaproteobacteria bacterium]